MGGLGVGIVEEGCFGVAGERPIHFIYFIEQDYKNQVIFITERITNLFA